MLKIRTRKQMSDIAFNEGIDTPLLKEIEKDITIAEGAWGEKILESDTDIGLTAYCFYNTQEDTEEFLNILRKYHLIDELEAEKSIIEILKIIELDAEDFKLIEKTNFTKYLFVFSDGNFNLVLYTAFN